MVFLQIAQIASATVIDVGKRYFYSSPFDVDVNIFVLWRPDVLA